MVSSMGRKKIKIKHPSKEEWKYSDEWAEIYGYVNGNRFRDRYNICKENGCPERAFLTPEERKKSASRKTTRPLNKKIEYRLRGNLMINGEIILRPKEREILDRIPVGTWEAQQL